MDNADCLKTFCIHDPFYRRWVYHGTEKPIKYFTTSVTGRHYWQASFPSFASVNNVSNSKPSSE